MSIRRRPALLERRWSSVEPEGLPELVPLPPLADFQAMPLEQQTHILLGWEPVMDEGVSLPWPADLDAMTEEDMTEEDWGRLLAALERVGREFLVPCVESLPLDKRIDLLREATQLLPPSQIWRRKAFRFACRPDWQRRREGQPDQLETQIIPERESP